MLYVEDNPDDQLILKHTLKEKLNINYDLVTVDAGTKGFDKLKKETFDLLLLDYRLPDMTGIEFIRELKKTDIKTPIILVTSKGSENIAVQAMKLGVQDYIIKEDIASKRLIDSIKDILLKASLPEGIELQTAKEITSMFEKKPIIHIESISDLDSDPKSEIPAEELVVALNRLSELNIVTIEPSHSIISCPECNSPTASLLLECPECESTKMTKEEAIEHFDCGNINFRSKYDDGEGKLVCPKCGKKLKVIGVDYRKIENWYKCSNNHYFGQPVFKFVCANCEKRFSLDDVAIDMLYNYALTGDGRQSLMLGLKVAELGGKSGKKDSGHKS
jgi:CheY-like chemotaxis protein/predicted RNA-binding Zn-ribbon protein involved in translation (DUF1610 family)